jgi:carbonic anhydrase
MSGGFDDLLAANRAYAEGFDLAGLSPRAAKGLAVVTCIDTRIEPLAMLGLRPGDAKIMRNAGGRASDDALRSLVLAVNMLGVERVAVVQHTRCALVGTTNDELRADLGARYGPAVREWDFLPIDDHERVLQADLERIRACELLPPDLVLGGFVYDVDRGLLQGPVPGGA